LLPLLDGLQLPRVYYSRRGRPTVVESDSTLRRDAESGDVDAAAELGGRLEAQGRYEEAAHWLDRAARAGHAVAAHTLGVILERVGDPDTAEQLYRRAAAAGVPASAYQLGQLLIHHRWRGESDAVMAEAITWLKRAASAGYPLAPDALAGFLRHVGSPEAAEWRQRADALDAELERAAKAGDSEAANLLGDLFYARNDVRKANKWWRRAGKAAAR
jgi:uncharacterized protein